MKARFTDFYPGENWTKGIIGGFIFEAKVYDVGSMFGINEGRVSKLSVFPEGGAWKDCIIHYDRGWDIEVSSREEQQILDAILELCENAPKRFS